MTHIFLISHICMHEDTKTQKNVISVDISEKKNIHLAND